MSFEYAIAISYSGDDRERVQPIVDRLYQLLGENRVFFDKNPGVFIEGKGGGSRLRGVFSGQSEFIVPFFSQSYADSDWCRLEWDEIQSLFDDPERKDHVLPVEIEPTKILGWNREDVAHRPVTWKAVDIAAHIVRSYRKRVHQKQPKSHGTGITSESLASGARKDSDYEGNNEESYEDWISSVMKDVAGLILQTTEYARNDLFNAFGCMGVESDGAELELQLSKNFGSAGEAEDYQPIYLAFGQLNNLPNVGRYSENDERVICEIQDLVFQIVYPPTYLSSLSNYLLPGSPLTMDCKVATQISAEIVAAYARREAPRFQPSDAERLRGVRGEGLLEILNPAPDDPDPKCLAIQFLKDIAAQFPASGIAYDIEGDENEVLVGDDLVSGVRRWGKRLDNAIALRSLQMSARGGSRLKNYGSRTIANRCYCVVKLPSEDSECERWLSSLKLVSSYVKNLTFFFLDSKVEEGDSDYVIMECLNSRFNRKG